MYDFARFCQRQSWAKFYATDSMTLDRRPQPRIDDYTLPPAIIVKDKLANFQPLLFAHNFLLME